jgi:hypothetical protein
LIDLQAGDRFTRGRANAPDTVNSASDVDGRFLAQTTPSAEDRFLALSARS